MDAFLQAVLASTPNLETAVFKRGYATQRTKGPRTRDACRPADTRAKIKRTRSPCYYPRKKVASAKMASVHLCCEYVCAGICVAADGGAILGLLRQCSSMKDLHVNSGWSNPLSPDLIVNALSEARAGGAPLLERLTLEPSFAQAVQMRGLVACAKRLPELQHLHLKALSLTGIEQLALGSDPFPKMQRLKCLEILAFGGAYGGGLATVRLRRQTRGSRDACVCAGASACAYAFAGAATGVGMVGSYCRLAMRISSPARGCTACAVAGHDRARGRLLAGRPGIHAKPRDRCF